jgi:hypothetical protein
LYRDAKTRQPPRSILYSMLCNEYRMMGRLIQSIVETAIGACPFRSLATACFGAPEVTIRAQREAVERRVETFVSSSIRTPFEASLPGWNKPAHLPPCGGGSYAAGVRGMVVKRAPRTREVRGIDLLGDATNDTISCLALYWCFLPQKRHDTKRNGLDESPP